MCSTPLLIVYKPVILMLLSPKVRIVLVLRAVHASSLLFSSNEAVKEEVHSECL